jgi:hypothetical protein
MATIEELRYWSFGGEAPAGGGTPLPDARIFRVMAYRFAPERHSEFRNEYLCASMTELPLSVELKRISKAFREANVRFAPIKGADLAESCYPDPTVRIRCDIDLVVHSDDIGRAVDIARAGGWRAAHQYAHDSHCPSMYKKNAMLELHFTLPDFAPEKMPAVWTKLVAQGESSEYRLPPELSLVVVFHHARSHRWINSPQLIADYAFLLKTHRGFDWKLAREYAAEFGAADPGVLCFALPELFPPEVMPDAPPPPEELRLALREAVLDPVNFQLHQEDEVMNRGDRFGGAWWKARIRGFAPSSVRIRYHLPDSADWRRMTAAYCRMLTDKVKLAVRGMRKKDPELIRALRRAETVERGLAKLEK